MVDSKNGTMFVALRKLSRRTIDLAYMLGIEVISIPSSTIYVDGILKVRKVIEERRPRAVIAQLPQGPLLWILVKLRNRYGYKLAADVHTGFLVYDDWRGYVLNRPFVRYLKHVDLVLVHNEDVIELLPKEVRSKAMVLYDPPPRIDFPLRKVFDFRYAVFPCSWASDEDVEYVINEFLATDTDLKLVITGDYRRRIDIYGKYVDNERIVFTGYIDRATYYSILGNAELVIVNTTREYTMLSTVWEALELEKPLVVSYTRTLSKILNNSVVFYNVDKVGSLSNVLRELQSNESMLNELRKRIRVLKNVLEEQRRAQLRRLMEWLRN